MAKEEKMEFKDKPLPNNFSRMIGFDQTHENSNRPEVGQSYDPGLTALLEVRTAAHGVERCGEV